MSILQKIIATKQQEVADFKNTVNLDELQQQADNYTPKGFANALKNKAVNHKLGIIAEIKKASPSKGIICQNFNPIEIAKGYQQAGASCLSVLTDRDYFMGSDEYLMAVRGVVDLPILRKDFMIDPIQITHAKAMGADCILLIMACLDDELLFKLHQHALNLDLDILIEIHNQEELDRALTLPPSKQNIYGINNRDLNTFVVDLNNSIMLGNQLKAQLGDDTIIVSESGIHGKEDIELLKQNGFYHYLIGEQFMKTDNAGLALAQLLQSV